MALLVSPERRHLFVAPCPGISTAKDLNFSNFIMRASSLVKIIICIKNNVFEYTDSFVVLMHTCTLHTGLQVEIVNKIIRSITMDYTIKRLRVRGSLVKYFRRVSQGQRMHFVGSPHTHTGHLVNSGTTRNMGEFWAPECFKLT